MILRKPSLTARISRRTSLRVSSRSFGFPAHKIFITDYGLNLQHHPTSWLRLLLSKRFTTSTSFAPLHEFPASLANVQIEKGHRTFRRIKSVMHVRRGFILIDGELALELHVIPTAGHVFSLSVSVDHARITSFYSASRKRTAGQS